MALIDDLRRGGAAGMPMPIAFDPENDKLTRMATQAAKIEAGHVFLPRSAAWLDDFRTELLQFPNGRHDDQVDSLSQFLSWIEKRSKETPFSCTWIDPRPMPENWPSVYVDEASPARAGHPTVLISQQRNGHSTLISRGIRQRDQGGDEQTLRRRYANKAQQSSSSSINPRRAPSSASVWLYAFSWSSSALASYGSTRTGGAATLASLKSKENTIRTGCSSSEWSWLGTVRSPLHQLCEIGRVGADFDHLSPNCKQRRTRSRSGWIRTDGRLCSRSVSHPNTSNRRCPED